MFNILLFILFVSFVILVYIRAVSSRSYYKCKECGESFRVELMKASCCKVCGAPVDRTYDPDVTDKAN